MDEVQVQALLPSLTHTTTERHTHMETTEKKAADAILENATDSITIGGVDYPIAPPTTATLILVSSLVSTMPVVDKASANPLYEVLATAKDMAVVGKIAATLILGAKRIKERREAVKAEAGAAARWRWPWRKAKSTRVLEVDALAERLLDEISTQRLCDIIVKRLGQSQFGDFFVLTTSLSEVNLLRRTREVETASGD